MINAQSQASMRSFKNLVGKPDLLTTEPEAQQTPQWKQSMTRSINALKFTTTARRNKRKMRLKLAQSVSSKVQNSAFYTKRAQ